MKNMKQLKRIIAFLMVFTLVLSSITIDNRVSKADDIAAKVILNFDDVYSGNTYDVSITNENKDEILPENEKKITLTKTATSTDAKNPFSQVTFDELKLTEGKYTVTVKTTSEKGLISQTTAFFEVSNKETKEYNVNVDLKTLTSYWNEIKVELKGSYKDVYYKIDKDKEKPAGVKEGTDGTIITISDSDGKLTVGSTITVWGTYSGLPVDGKTQGFEYKSDVTITAEENVYNIDLKKDTGKYSKYPKLLSEVDLSEVENVLYREHSAEEEKKYQSLNIDTIFESGKTYDIKIEAKNVYQKLSVEGLSNGKHSPSQTGENWKDTVLFENVTLNNEISLKVTVSKPKLVIKPDATELSCVPGIPVTLSYTIGFDELGDDYTVPSDVKVISTKGTDEDPYGIEDNQNVKVNWIEERDLKDAGDVKDDEGAKIGKRGKIGEIKLNAEDARFEDAEEKTIAVKATILDIQPRTDFTIEGCTNAYYDSNNNKLFYRIASETAKISLTSDNYTQYRYAVQTNGIYGAYEEIKDIADNAKIEISNDTTDAIKLQMLNQDEKKYGVGSIELAFDNDAPKIVNKNGDEIDENEEFAYCADNSAETSVAMEKVLGDLKGKDAGSGIAGIWVAEGEKGENEFDGTEAKLEEYSLESSCRDKWFTLFVKDNVGNINAYPIKITVDLEDIDFEVGVKADGKDVNAVEVDVEGTKSSYYYINNKESNLSLDMTVTSWTLGCEYKEHKLSIPDAQNPKPMEICYKKEGDTDWLKVENIKNIERGVSLSIKDNQPIKYEEKLTIPAETFEDGKYEFEFSCKNLNENDTKSFSTTIIVDNTRPGEIKVYAEPVKVENPYTTDGIDAFEKYADLYTAYNSNSKIVWSYEDTNPYKVQMCFNNKNYTVNKEGYTNSQDTNSQNEFQNYLKEEVYKAGAVKFTFEDKAGNADEIYMKRDQNGTEAVNIYYITKEVSLSNLKFDSTGRDGKTGMDTCKVTKSNKQNLVTGSVEYDKNAGTPLSEFFALYAVNGSNRFAIPDEDIHIGTDGKITFKTDAVKWPDGDYVLNAYYYDIAAAQIKKVSSKAYTYDVTVPTLTSEFQAEKGIITYTLTDKNPDFSEFKVSASGKNNDGTITGEKMKLNGKAVDSFQMLAAKLKTKEGWKENNGVYTASIYFEPEGLYQISVTAIDSAKQKVKKADSIKYDVTAPKLDNYIVKTENTTTNKNYSQFDRKEAEIEVELQEAVSKKVTLSYVLHDDETGKDSNKTVSNLKQDKSTFTGSFKIPANFKGTIKFDTTDGNGNATSKSIKYENGVVVENDKMHEKTSDVAITEVNPTDARNNIYNENVKLSFAVKDTYSGIQSIKYSINGTEKNVELNQKGNIIKTWNGSESIAATHANEGDKVPVVITVTDNAGHVTKEEKEYKIDITEPVISVAYDNNSPQNDKYYNQTRTATITIKEHNFDNDGVVLTIKRDGAIVSAAPNFHYAGTDTYAMNYAFAEDGDYEFTLSCTDLAGNKADYKQTDTFTVDKTKPAMTISYDNNKANAGNYYGEERTATITVTEHNFDPNGIKVNITATKDGVSVGTPSVSGFSTSGDTHTATVHFAQDADYTISATSLDLAGNVGEEIPQQAFTVDLTAPEISIEGVTNNTSYTGSVMPTVKVTDTNYNSEGITLTLVGGKNGTRNATYATTTVANGENFTFSDLAHTQDMDDCYVLTASAVDKAGHETKETISYRVNRFGSVYSMNEELEQAVENYYTSASDSFAITEQNVDELKTYSISYTIGTDIQELQEGTDFTVTKAENKAGWNEYVYNLSKDTFEKEGIYTISVSSEDKAENLSDNKSKGVDMEFCIDNTAPVCIISGVEEGQKFERDVTADIGIEVYDNIKFASMKVELNGQQIKSESDLQDGKLSISVNPTSGNQVLKVTCYDAAGNEKIEEIQFTFDMGLLQSHLWIVIVIVGICVILLGFVIVVLAKKRKENR